MSSLHTVSKTSDKYIDECSICLLPIINIDSHCLPCKHLFHKKCIYKWFEKDDIYRHYTKYHNIPIAGQCPLCRTDISDIIFGKDGGFGCLPTTKCSIS